MLAIYLDLDMRWSRNNSQHQQTTWMTMFNAIRSVRDGKFDDATSMMLSSSAVQELFKRYDAGVVHSPQFNLRYIRVHSMLGLIELLAERPQKALVHLAAASRVAVRTHNAVGCQMAMNSLVVCLLQMRQWNPAQVALAKHEELSEDFEQTPAEIMCRRISHMAVSYGNEQWDESLEYAEELLQSLREVHEINFFDVPSFQLMAIVSSQLFASSHSPSHPLYKKKDEIAQVCDAINTFLKHTCSMEPVLRPYIMFHKGCLSFYRNDFDGGKDCFQAAAQSVEKFSMHNLGREIQEFLEKCDTKITQKAMDEAASPSPLKESIAKQILRVSPTPTLPQ